MQSKLIQSWAMLIVLFSCVSAGAWNYMINFPMFVPALFAVISLAFCLFTKWDRLYYPKVQTFLLCSCMILCGTKWHVFGGDMLTVAIDSNYPIQFRRLSEILLSSWLHFFFNYFPMEHLDKMAAVVASQIFYTFFGVLAMLMIYFTFKTYPILFWFVSTGAWMLNCFGNIDAYTPSLFFALVIIHFHLRFQEKGYTWARWCWLSLLTGIGLYMHPLFLFMVILPVSEFIELTPFRKISGLLWVLFFLVVAAALKSTSYAPNWHTFRPELHPPVFSMYTAINLFNNYILLLIPLTICLWRTKWWIVWLGSCWTLAMLVFSMGSADQFNYQQVALMLALIGISIGIKQKIDWSPLHIYIPIQFWLMWCAVYVGVSDSNIERAKLMYPLDKGHHNNIMSFQTHLGIVLLDNTQQGDAGKNAAIEIFKSGVTNSNGMLNHCLYVSSLYNYGMVKEGREALRYLLSKAPQAVGPFLNERPAFGYNNRDLLWDDLLLCYPARNERERLELSKIITQLKASKKLYRKSLSVYEQSH